MGHGAWGVARWRTLRRSFAPAAGLFALVARRGCQNRLGLEPGPAIAAADPPGLCTLCRNPGRSDGARRRGEAPGCGFARLGAVSAHGHQLPAAWRRIANSGEPHSGQWPSQPGRPFGRVTSRGSAMVTFWPQTHQPCGPGCCSSSVCDSTMFDKHISWLRAPSAGAPSMGCSPPATEGAGPRLGATASRPIAIASCGSAPTPPIRGGCRTKELRPDLGGQFTSSGRPEGRRRAYIASSPSAGLIERVYATPSAQSGSATQRLDGRHATSATARWS